MPGRNKAVEDDEEFQSLLSKPSDDVLTKSKRLIIETREIGTEVLRSLESDSDKVRSVRRKQDKVNRHLDEAERTSSSIERAEMIQFAFVCCVLFVVLIGLIGLLVRMIMRLDSTKG